MKPLNTKDPIEVLDGCDQWAPADLIGPSKQRPGCWVVELNGLSGVYTANEIRNVAPTPKDPVRQALEARLKELRDRHLVADPVMSTVIRTLEDVLALPEWNVCPSPYPDLREFVNSLRQKINSYPLADKAKDVAAILAKQIEAVVERRERQEAAVDQGIRELRKLADGMSTGINVHSLAYLAMRVAAILDRMEGKINV